MPRGRTLTLTFTLCVLALSLASCGTSSNRKLLPPDDAAQLTTWLDQIDTWVAEGSCDSAKRAADDVATRINQLSSGVDPTLKERLAEAALNLQTLVNSPSGCSSNASPSTPTPRTPTQTSTNTSTQGNSSNPPNGNGGAQAPGVNPPAGGGTTTGTTTSTTTTPTPGGGVTP